MLPCLTNLPLRCSLRFLCLDKSHFFLRAIFQVLGLLINAHLGTSILGAVLLSPEELGLKLFQLFHFPFVGAVLAFFIKTVRRALLALCVLLLDFFWFLYDFGRTRLTLLFLFGFDGFWLTLNDFWDFLIAIVVFNCSAVVVGALLGGGGQDDCAL